MYWIRATSLLAIGLLVPAKGISSFVTAAGNGAGKGLTGDYVDFRPYNLDKNFKSVQKEYPMGTEIRKDDTVDLIKSTVTININVITFFGGQYMPMPLLTT